MLFTSLALKEQYLKCQFPGTKQQLPNVILGITSMCNKD